MDGHKFNKEMASMEERIKDFVVGQTKILQDDLNAHKKELCERVRYFDEKTSELQQGTLWKIRDFEKLLASRVSE